MDIKFVEKWARVFVFDYYQSFSWKQTQLVKTREFFYWKT